MSTFTSTIPGAITTLQGYMNTVAAASSVPDVQVLLGYTIPRTGMSYNFMMVGDFENGILWQPAEGTWEDLPVAAKRRQEKYSLNGCICTFAGGTDLQSRLNDAFSLLDALYEQILSDPGANTGPSGNNTLTPSGSWGRLSYRNLGNGPFVNTAGFGVVIDFELEVINALPVG